MKDSLTKKERKRKPFNDYRIDGETTYLVLTDKNYVPVAEIMIDTDQLKALRADGYRWSLSSRKKYAVRSFAGEKPVCISLHRQLTNAPDGLVVDHINNNTFDNRLSNLRVVTHSENGTNRKGAALCSNTGIRNVRHRPDLKEPYRVIFDRARQGMPYISIRCATLNIARITAEMKRVDLWGVEAA